MASVNNIEALREARGWKRPALAKRMKTSTQQVERLEKGQRKLSQEWIDRAADALGVPPADIITAGAADHDEVEAPRSLPQSSDRQPTRTADAGETVGLQKLDLSLPMGPGTEIGDYVEAEIVQFDLALVRAITRSPPHRLRIVTGFGHSMEPNLHTGDMILIDTTDRHLSWQDGIYWINLFGAAALKRLRTVSKERVLVVSDNPTVPDQEVDAADLRIEGRAVWFARGL